MKKLINKFRIQRLIENSRFEDAIQLLNKLESNNEFSQESINLYRNLCLDGKITDLYTQSSSLFSKAKYKECRETLEEVHKIIVANSAKLGFIIDSISARKLATNICASLLK